MTTTTTISVRLSATLRAQLQALATINGTSVSAIAEEVLRNYVATVRADVATLETARQRLRGEAEQRLAEQLHAIDLLTSEEN